MTIGAAWNLDDPAKPWALWDPHADVKIPLGLDDWLTVELGTTYGSHQIIAPAPLECADPGTYASGTVLVRMRLATGATFVPGQKYPFTVRVTGADTTTKDDRTLWLKVKDR